eukprot:TRINITY_DN1574_c0_g1_i2.p1 TRINITY_DN1574_c0_g1~~TRINITY_DN1574_c0_g1_i2.p1  ORF type:complete len:493 (-),score=102.94 TRINITY_DN1574_c0_g1_i2:360-1838(-)
MSSDFDEEDEEPSSSNTATTVNHHYDESDDDYSTSDVSEDDDGESDEERFNGGLETTQYNFDETESSEDHNITDGMGTSVVRTDIEDDTDQSEDDSVNTTSSPDLAQPNNSFLSGANANSTTIIRDMDEPVTNGTTVVIHDNHNEDNAQDHQLVRSNGRQSLVVSDKNSTTGETPRKNMSSRHASEGVLLIDQKLRRESQGQSTVFRSESSPTLRKNRSKLNVDHSRLDSSRSEPSRPELSRLDSSRPETSRMDSTRSEPTSRLDSSRVDSSRLDSSRIVETSRLDSSRTDSSRFDSRDTSRLEKSQRNKQSKDEEEDVSPFLVPDRDMQASYISYGNLVLIKWRYQDHDEPLCKAVSPQASYPYIRCTVNKKFKGKSAVFRIQLKQQGPVKLKKTPKVNAMLIGELNYDFKPNELDEVCRILGNPRDTLSDALDPSETRSGFIFVYENLPLDPGRKINGFNCRSHDYLDFRSIFPNITYSPMTGTYSVNFK